MVTFPHYNNGTNPSLTELSGYTADKQPSLGHRWCEERGCKPLREGHSQSEPRAGKLQPGDAARREGCSKEREGGKAAVIGGGKDAVIGGGKAAVIGGEKDAAREGEARRLL